jgi:Na+/serine symporter
MKSRIFINGMSLVAANKRNLHVLPLGNALKDCDTRFSNANVEVTQLSGFEVLGIKLKIESDYSKAIIKDILDGKQLVTIEFVIDGYNHIGLFFIYSSKMSKKGNVKLKALSSGEVTVTIPEGSK